MAALPARGVLAARGAGGRVLRQLDGRQHLLLLRAQRVGVEGDRLLHRGQRQQLQQVVLDHVAGGADPVVVARPAADADVLGHRDLDVVDVPAVPDRLVHFVGEAQRQDVLDGLLAQVVVDAEHRLGREDLGQDVVQLPGALQIMTERLLDDHPAPGAAARPRRLLPFGRRVVVRIGQPGPLELLHDDRERLGRDRQVERVVPARAPLGVQGADGLGQAVEGGVVVELPLDEPDPLTDLLPNRVPERRPRVLLDRLVGELGEVLVLPVPPGEADQGEPRREQPAVGQVVDRGQQLLARQVTGHAEHDQHTWAGHPGYAPVPRIPQRVLLHLRVREGRGIGRRGPAAALA